MQSGTGASGALHDHSKTAAVAPPGLSHQRGNDPAANGLWRKYLARTMKQHSSRMRSSRPRRSTRRTGDSCSSATLIYKNAFGPPLSIRRRSRMRPCSSCGIAGQDDRAHRQGHALRLPPNDRLRPPERTRRFSLGQLCGKRRCKQRGISELSFPKAIDEIMPFHNGIRPPFHGVSCAVGYRCDPTTSRPATSHASVVSAGRPSGQRSWMRLSTAG